ncbi:hypothetical protein [Pinibacter aurantiacus]|uniref:Uncharacterized protein n=1 Tax=Pinibacter aurantiacus TaxID=2851599 RepID=A0A9E2SBR0_9BACT|nr:hypothetical protein [Pinibacter aurantiacus]MBV4359621.1 hypothetical protein [Pinibacter aurantiacus]
MNAKSSESVLLLQYGLKTYRQKRRAVVKDRDKQLLSLDKKRKQLWREERALGWEELKHPYQRGWKRTFVLREDIATGKKSSFYRNLLQKINTVQHSSSKNFTKKKRVRGKKVHKPREQKLREFYDYELDRVRLSQAELMLFTKLIYYSQQRKIFRMKYVFSEPWCFVLKVEPNMITKVQKHDSSLRSNIVQLENYLRKKHLEDRITKLRNGSVHWWGYKIYDLKQRDFNALRNQTLTNILDQHWYNE